MNSRHPTVLSHVFRVRQYISSLGPRTEMKKSGSNSLCAGSSDVYSWLTCVLEAELDRVRLALKHVISGVVVLVRVNQRYTVRATHRIT